MFETQIPKQPSQDAIIVENVSKRFLIPKEKRRTVLENLTGILRNNSYEEFNALKTISFKVKKGETLGIIGENGSGKSTLLKIIAGVLQPDTGTVKVSGKIAPFLELGVGFQPELTALENVSLYCSIMGMSHNMIVEKLDGIFEFAELERFREMKLKNFSSGMYARLAFATAFATEPDIYLIDEVLAVGDEAFQRKCMDKIDEIKSTNRTIVFVSHDMAAVKRLCKRTIFLEHGRIRFSGNTEKVIFSYHSYLNEKEIRDFKRSIKKEIAPMELISEAIIPLEDTIPIGEKPPEEKPKDRWGTREIEIIDLKILNENNIEENVFKTGEKIRLQINYKINKDFSDPTFGIGFSANDGTYIYGTTTRLDDFTLDLSKDIGNVYLDIDNLVLLSGVFHITVGIWSGDNWLNPHDVHLNKYTFKIINEKKYDGFIKIPCQWAND